ncbi:MAG: radical SAM protein [Kiritimatiellae bacterium]|nr:radical SAM protein [Kiritimatiellia bacterium]
MSSRDPFGELAQRRSLPPGLKQRFPDRVLVMTTDRCFCACPHCTRKFILGKSPVVDSPERLAVCVDYVKRHSKVRDVLLSGGDVLTLPDAKVAKFVDAFAKLDQIEVVRICTRAPVVSPARVTARLARLLRRVGRGKVWANVHINTADEARLAREAAARLIDCGIPVSSQTVLLRGLNDTPRKMLSLLLALSAARIRPYYVFQCDPVEGLQERFGVPLARAKEIEAYCAERIGGLALPRFVADLPAAKRKTPLDLL